MFLSGESWTFVLCSKTFDFNRFCPLCKATSELYQGTAADKKLANNYKRKEKFVGNFYISLDPRDSEREEEDRVVGKVMLYEFPSKVEMKLKEEITDTRNGLGADIFNPGDGGFNFILKVLATKKDRNGNIWPDYSSSTFARRSSALGNREEIKTIMESTIDIDEYIEGLVKTDEDIISLMKSEMIWDLAKDDYARFSRRVESEETESTQSSTEVTEVTSSEEDATDEELLRELEGL